jgi:hypothetical protein
MHVVFGLARNEPANWHCLFPRNCVYSLRNCAFPLATLAFPLQLRDTPRNGTVLIYVRYLQGNAETG